MTLQALRRDGPGAFTYAGLHQDLLIYRAAEKKVETIRPSGTWIGIVDDIAGKLAAGRLELGLGAVLLLFTDGVTEATKNGAMLDVSGLADLLRELGGETAAQIRDGISARLGDFECRDDVSVVVVRNGRPAEAV
jgi:sigma-B regulation protein RsbU (phosphoserine phosphatase)